MRRMSRRVVLRAGMALSGAGLLSGGVLAAEDEHSSRHSPHLDKYVAPLPIPEERTPDHRFRGGDFHEVTVTEAQHSFHPDLPDTTIWGYDGQFPGTIIAGHRGRRLAARFDNSGLPDEHLLSIDDRIAGTTTENYVGYDGPVPEVRTVTHFHGLNVPPESDGQADMWVSPDGVKGPRHARDVQILPNRQSRLTSTYHDHARGISSLNGYLGLVGAYYIRGPWERILGLPDDEYDVPLVLADRTFDHDGSLHYPEQFVPNFAGDTPTVNGAAWPYLEVEPRRYRFRFINVSNGRTYGLGLESDDGHAPPLYQFSAGHGFLDGVVSIGHGGDMSSLVLAPFERADVIVDFSENAGETLTVTNDAAFPYAGGSHDDGMDGGHDDGMDGGMDGGDDGMDGGDGGMDGGMDGGDGGMGGGHGDEDHPEIHEIMQFRVAEGGGGWDRSVAPTRLPLRGGRSRRGHRDRVRTTRSITMEMEMGSSPGLHTLNGERWGDPISIKPQLGSTEIWELENNSMHTHPIHLHLVSFEVIGRGPDGTEPPLPNERGHKDTVRVDPNETVRIKVKFGDFPGRFPFHCHILEHEEHDMMRPFEVVTGRGRRGRRDRRDRRNRGDRHDRGSRHDDRDRHED